MTGQTRDAQAFGKVAVLYGGWSAEREVSLWSGQNVHEALRRRGVQADLVDVTSYDSFPASDPPSWIATGVGSPHSDESPEPPPHEAPQIPPPAPTAGDEHVENGRAVS